MTADSATLLALAAYVEAGTGPDREMDALVWVALHPELEAGSLFKGAVRRMGSPTNVSAPPLTASVDAALALFEQVLPGWGHSLWKGDGNYYPDHNREVSVWRPTPRGNEPLGPHIHGSAPTLARAILAAVLKAAATITPQEK